MVIAGHLQPCNLAFWEHLQIVSDSCCMLLPCEDLASLPLISMRDRCTKHACMRHSFGQIALAAQHCLSLHEKSGILSLKLRRAGGLSGAEAGRWMRMQAYAA